MSRYPVFESITLDQFLAHWRIRPGQSNPERVLNPYWNEMARIGGNPWFLKEHLGLDPMADVYIPSWGFSRVGMSTTLLDDLRIVHIGGAHCDGYDRDYAVYSDVVVRTPKGEIEIYTYPLDDFQPTAYHSATLVEEQIYIIGCSGNSEDVIIGTTPIYKLDTSTMEIKKIEVPGIEPGWISRHTAVYVPEENSILILGGKISGRGPGPNRDLWTFSLTSLRWQFRGNMLDSELAPAQT